MAYFTARRRYRRRTPELLTDAELSDELAALLDDTLDDLRAEPDPRRAVIAAYARTERALGAYGFPRRSFEAPLEYLDRIAAPLHEVQPSARRLVFELTHLFERAKFSSHAIDAEMKDDAIATLGGLTRRAADRGGGVNGRGHARTIVGGRGRARGPARRRRARQPRPARRRRGSEGRGAAGSPVGGAFAYVYAGLLVLGVLALPFFFYVYARDTPYSTSRRRRARLSPFVLVASAALGLLIATRWGDELRDAFERLGAWAGAGDSGPDPSTHGAAAGAGMAAASWS